MSQLNQGDPREPDLSFGSAQYKVLWAEAILKQLEIELEELLVSHRQTGGAFFDPITGRSYIGNFPLHPKFACMSGDIVFNLRSALDCCWMGLHRAIDADADKKTLPRGDAANVAAHISKLGKLTRAFPMVEAFLMNELQARKDGNEVLWFLAQVDNWNKHNMLVLLGQETKFTSATFGKPGGGQIKLYDSTISGCDKIPAFGSDQPLELQENAEFSFEVILHSRKPLDNRYLIPFLRSALIETRKGVDLFGAKFTKVYDPRF